MKIKRIGISIIALFISCICGLGIISLPKKEINVSAADTVTYNQYMLESGVPSKKALTTSAGSLFINGEKVESGNDLSYVFKLTEPNIVLEAKANQGFELKGWFIAYEDKAVAIEGTNNGYIAIADAEQSICEDNILVYTYSLVNKNAAIKILQMTDNLIIAPVFDYQYYKVTLKGVNFEKEITNTGYPGFKFGDTVTISETIDNDVNIDALSMVSSQIDLVKNDNSEELAGEYTFTKDETTGRTTAYSTKFTMSVYEDVVVELVYDNLYQVDLKLVLEENKLTSGTEFNQILSCVTLTKDIVKDKDGNDVEVDRFFKKLTNTSYFVKNGANFEISASNNFKNNGYIYYNFSSIDGNTSRRILNLNNISSNKIVEIKYVHNTFRVQFVGVEYNPNKTVRVNSDIEVVEDVLLTRVDSPLMLDNSLLPTGETWQTKNVGYTFVGFATRGKVEYNTDTDLITSYTLNNESPEDVVIYVLYKRTSYSLKLTNLDSVYLTNTSGNTIYPVASAKVGAVEETGTNIEFNGYYIGDTITLELKLNAGFDVVAIKYGTEENDKLTKDAEKQIYTFTLDKAFLTGKDEVIELEIIAETLKYTLTYKINEYKDGSNNSFAMADISIEGYTLTKTIVDGYYQVSLDNLTYYQTLNLKSKANGTGTTGEYFVFRWFTTDFKSTLSEGLTNDAAVQTTHTLPFTMYGDSVVYVVYSQPKTQLRIDIDSAPENAGIGFVVSQLSNTVTAVDGLYEISKGGASEKVDISISGLESNDKLFGYKYINTKLYILNESNALLEVSNSEQISTTQYSFEPNTSYANAIYVVVVKIETIKYQFSLTESKGAFTYTKNLTVEDATIEFNKQQGYFVKQVQFREKASYGDGVVATYKEYAKMNQNNDSRNGLIVNGKDYFAVYYYGFNTVAETGKALSEFEEIIETYGYVDGSNVIVELLVTFEVYTYDINVKYVKFNGEDLDNSTGNKLIYPQIQLSYKMSYDGESSIASFENLSSEVKFKGVPYGAIITLDVLRGVSAGFEMKGWYNWSNGSDIATYQLTSDGTLVGEQEKLIKFYKENIKKDFKLCYRVDFKEYQIVLDYEAGAGNPLVNNAKSATVKMGDKIEIIPNASLGLGYMFYQFEYTIAQFVHYNYVDDATFAIDALNLYLVEGDYVFKNISTTYNDKFNYYTLSTATTTSNASIFTDNSFDAGRYVDNAGVVKFVVKYIPIEMTIDNISKAIERFEDGNKILDALNLEKVGLTAEDIAIYTITATSGGVTRPIIENESIVTINDIITINVQINKAALSSNSGANIYDLSKGLSLYSYPLTNNWNNLSFEDLGGGAYKISFVVAENIKPTFAQEGKISIEYGYRLNDPKTVIATTNISGAEEFNKNATLKITGATTSVSENSGLIGQQNTFLQTVKVELLLNGLDEYFVINSITAYKGSQTESNIIKNLETYFIKYNEKTLTGSDRVVIESVELTMLDADIIIQFNVQPRIYIEGEEITTQPEKVITRTYNYEINDGKIVGKAQDIKLGSDISGYGISSDIMEVVAYKGNVKLDDGAIDVGEYVLKLEFKTGINEDKKQNNWLNYIKELPCLLKLKINPEMVQITFDKTETKQFEREYSPSTNYDLALIRNGNKLTTGDGNIVIAGVAKAKIFDLGMFSFSGGKAEVVAYGSAGELVSQRNVSGNYVHILITGLTLTNNKNFELKFNEYTYALGLQETEKCSGLLVTDVIKIVPKKVGIKYLDVYDKIYDGNEIAKFGLTEGENKYVLEFIYTEDDVYLSPEELKVYFANAAINDRLDINDVISAEVDQDKFVVVDARTALAGKDKDNYVIGDFGTGLFNYEKTKTIYPDKLVTSIKGVGNVTLINKRGLTDYTKANLIPVDSTLTVERIEPNSAGFTEIQENLTSFLSRRNVFAAGYKLLLLDKNGMEVKISNELYLSLPSENDLISVLSLSGDRTKEVNYTTEGGYIVLDLSQIEEDISYICLIQSRALLKPWQIVLIVVLSVVAAGGIGVAVFFIVRRRRLRNEKYDVI